VCLKTGTIQANLLGIALNFCFKDIPASREAIGTEVLGAIGQFALKRWLFQGGVPRRPERS